MQHPLEEGIFALVDQGKASLLDRVAQTANGVGKSGRKPKAGREDSVGAVFDAQYKREKVKWWGT